MKLLIDRFISIRYIQNVFLYFYTYNIDNFIQSIVHFYRVILLFMFLSNALYK